MAQFVSDCLRTMRLALARRNPNDPDSSDTVFLQYLNDFINLTMTDDVKVFENFGTLTFVIDETSEDGVFTFEDLGIPKKFSNISQEAFISLTLPPNGSISWNQLDIYQDPGQFFYVWGVDNADVLIRGYPTMMLYYGEEFTFRTIPNTSYTVTIYGYTINNTLDSEGDAPIPHDYWMRYLAYGAAMNYARDYRFEGDKRQMLAQDFAHERKQLLTRTHQQIKQQRAYPRF